MTGLPLATAVELELEGDRVTRFLHAMMLPEFPDLPGSLLREAIGSLTQATQQAAARQRFGEFRADLSNLVEP